MKMEEEEDDRWSSFVDTSRTSGLGVPDSSEPKPKLGDYINKVLLKKTPGQQHQRKFTVALELIKLVTEAAYNLDDVWASFIRMDTKKGVRIAPLRSLAEDQYECMVIIKRPMRMDGFRIVQCPLDELPQHRCLVQLNHQLSREERRLVQNEWEVQLDTDGFLRPDRTLDWFNAGIEKACVYVLRDSHNVDKLSITYDNDGTVTLNATMTKYENNVLLIDEFTVNIFPSIVLPGLPKTFKLVAPVPSFGPYIQGQKEFRELVLQEVEEGKEVVFIDPKSEQDDGQVRGGLSRDGRSWKINISLTQYHVYSIIDKYSRGINFRHVLILMSIITAENKADFRALNNEMVVSTLFWVARKHIDKLRTKDDWTVKLLHALVAALRAAFLPSFHLPRQNLLVVYGVSEEGRLAALSKLQEIISALKSNPKNLFSFTGYSESDGAGDDRDVEVQEGGEEQKRDESQRGGTSRSTSDILDEEDELRSEQ